jgi:hypothetical protein
MVLDKVVGISKSLDLNTRCFMLPHTIFLMKSSRLCIGNVEDRIMATMRIVSGMPLDIRPTTKIASVMLTICLSNRRNATYDAVITLYRDGKSGS